MQRHNAGMSSKAGRARRERDRRRQQVAIGHDPQLQLVPIEATGLHPDVAAALKSALGTDTDGACNVLRLRIAL
jgi:hypothetical protein